MVVKTQIPDTIGVLLGLAQHLAILPCCPDFLWSFYEDRDAIVLGNSQA